MGHGHVIPNADGSKARCGGPAICSVCAAELGQKLGVRAHFQAPTIVNESDLIDGEICPTGRSEYSYEYRQKCPKCSRDQVVQTQRDLSPEYYTQVYVKCPCGEFIEFKLPVN
jgi:hypothetical protein